MRRLALFLIPLVALALVAIGCCGLEPEPIPEKWRYGDLAVYLLSFPYPTYETKVVNATTGETVVVEKPAEVSEISIVMVVWNAEPDNPVIVSIDEEEHKIVREGYYQLSFKESPGLHHVVIYCEYKIFEEATVRVKPPPPLPLMITWEEFLRKLREAKEEVIKNLLIASAGGVAVGLWLKRKTRIFSYWAVLVLALPMIPAYNYIMDYYPLFGLSIAGVLAYWLSPVFAQMLAVVILQEGKGGIPRFFGVKRLYLDDEGYAVLGVSPRHWRSGFILKKPVEIKEPNTVTVNLDGEWLEGVAAWGVEEAEDRIIVHGSQALADLVKNAKVYEMVIDELGRKAVELEIWKSASPLVLSRELDKIDEARREADVEEAESFEELAEKVKKVLGSLYGETVLAEEPAVEEEGGKVEEE